MTEEGRKADKMPEAGKAPEAERRPFKEGLDRDAVAHIGRRISLAWPEFDEAAFVKSAAKGLEDLELKDRVRHVIAAMHAYLPEDYPRALEIVLSTATGWERQERGDKLGGFAVWPLIDFVGEHGLEHFDASMEALRILTPLWSAEFAIRPLIDRDQQNALRHLGSWVGDDDEHVRRLVSEGTRTRLPWGGRLNGFIADPAPVLELLEALRDDSSEYVRRSVANNLNDISKDHPEVVVEVCGRWSDGASKDRAKLIRHALRSLVKQGQPGALRVLGFDPEVQVEVRGLGVEPDRVRVGESLRIGFELESMSDREEPLVVDYAVHHVKKAGHRTAKVFKLKTLRLAPRARLEIGKKHPFKAVTVRTYHRGTHVIEILVNGRSRGEVAFELVP